jgi:hypothetical protein
MNPACWMTYRARPRPLQCPDHAATLDAAGWGQPPLQPPPRAERAAARSLTGNLHAPHADGRAAADSSRALARSRGGGVRSSVDPKFVVVPRVLGMSSNVPRFTTPRKPGDSRAKRCPTPFPSYPFHVPAAASERSERSVNPACYLMQIALVAQRHPNHARSDSPASPALISPRV